MALLPCLPQCPARPLTVTPATDVHSPQTPRVIQQKLPLRCWRGQGLQQLHYTQCRAISLQGPSRVSSRMKNGGWIWLSHLPPKPCLPGGKARPLVSSREGCRLPPTRVSPPALHDPATACSQRRRPGVSDCVPGAHWLGGLGRGERAFILSSATSLVRWGSRAPVGYWLSRGKCRPSPWHVAVTP